jgi:DNA-binding transcriptional MerR regulator
MTDTLSSREQAREWRAEGLTLAEIRERCIELGILTCRGEPPSISTLHAWVKDIDPKQFPKPKTKPRPRKRLIERRKGNEGLRARVRQLRATGTSLRAITDAIEADGYRNSKGNPIGKTQIIRIIDRLDTASFILDMGYSHPPRSSTAST